MSLGKAPWTLFVSWHLPLPPKFWILHFPPRRTPRMMGGFDLLRGFICRGASLYICSFACFSLICQDCYCPCVCFNVYSNCDLIIHIYNDTILQYTIPMPCPLALILAGIIVLCLQSCSHPDSLICPAHELELTEGPRPFEFLFAADRPASAVLPISKAYLFDIVCSIVNFLYYIAFLNL